VFDRIAVIRRDELAMRLIGTVREHNAMHGSGTRVIAPRTEAECRRPLPGPRGTAAARRGSVRSEKLGEVTAEFETIHDIKRPRQVGSVHDIIPAVPAGEPRPRLIVPVERGMEPAGRT
jgi:hypothetical protein